MRRRATSFRAAWLGIVYTTATQTNFRIEAAIGAAAILLAVLLAAPLAPILLVCTLVLSLEVLNTAVEATIDLLSPAHHDTARIAKDCAAGAVLLASVGAVAIGLITLGPPLLDRLASGGP